MEYLMVSMRMLTQPHFVSLYILGPFSAQSLSFFPQSSIGLFLAVIADALVLPLIAI